MIRALLRRPVSPPAKIAGIPVKPSLRARRMSLLVEPRTGEVVLVLPRRTSEKSALRFITENKKWIAKQRALVAATAAPRIAHGSSLSILGHKYTIVHRPGRGLTRIEGDCIIVTGDAAHLRRRLTDFLKTEAERILTLRTRRKTARLGLEAGPVRIRDPKTRWGSCTEDGQIMLSWRLILAPERVMDYVVAHEVAHRLHMDHSRRFWKVCMSLTPDASGAREWIRLHGHELLRDL